VHDCNAAAINTLPVMVAPVVNISRLTTKSATAEARIAAAIESKTVGQS
jgi:hypothetical protein